MHPRRILLAPFAWLYAAVLALRHAVYDTGLAKSVRPATPTIAIGNLALGGTGKTPMLELVLRLLDGTSPIATLSRGYGRAGTDFHEVRAEDDAARSGDEPVQVKRNYPSVRVFVGADRVRAIARIQGDVPGVKAVVLDDTLQHRRLDAGLNILLTTWQRPWCEDALLPAGRLRDLPSRSKAAQVVVVSKCPALPDTQEQARWRSRLGLHNDQELFFAGIEYEGLCVVSPHPPGPPNKSAGTDDRSLATDHALLVTGIADPDPLVRHLRSKARHVEHIAFPDHHRFSPADLARLAERYGTFAPGPKTLVTTEKDAVRLVPLLAGSPLERVPVATIGMRTVILNAPERFAELIRRHVGTHPAHR